MCCETKPTHLVVCDAAHKQEFVRSCVDLCYVLKKVRDSQKLKSPASRMGEVRKRLHRLCWLLLWVWRPGGVPQSTSRCNWGTQSCIRGTVSPALWGFVCVCLCVSWVATFTLVLLPTDPRPKCWHPFLFILACKVLAPCVLHLRLCSISSIREITVI